MDRRIFTNQVTEENNVRFQVNRDGGNGWMLK